MILVVDDNASNQYVAKVVLEKFGLEAQIIDNGQEAVRLVTAGQSNFEMILMDCRMPDFDGYETTQAIRQAESKHGKRTPIIGVTACALEGDRERCLEAGMDDYYTKPLTLERFRELLERWLPNARVRLST